MKKIVKAFVFVSLITFVSIATPAFADEVKTTTNNSGEVSPNSHKDPTIPSED
ncbi:MULTISPECIES: hypothetical protein [Bacillus]|uniref:hypothetical protein n=1 Tax=Bacillus TaxID=1386 RepID=UPI0012FE83C3|nr:MULTISPECIES: hypothetical protein [Bacillus]